MTNDSLAQDYYRRALIRLEVLHLLLSRGAFADTIRESQELLELLLKGLLRLVGIDPPKWHDVSKILLENAELFRPEVQAQLGRIATLSRNLRKEREMSFYGDDDFIPSESYDQAAAQGFVDEVTWVIALVRADFESENKN